MIIIVTCDTGFIGSNFIFHMLAKHPDYCNIYLDKLTCVDNIFTLKGAMVTLNFRFVKADIFDRIETRL